MRFYQTLGHGQAKSHALLSRCEERVEHPGLDILGNAYPCVLEAHRGQVLARPGSNLQLPSIRHRLKGIGDYVGESSAEQAWVDVQFRKACLNAGGDLYGRRYLDRGESVIDQSSHVILDKGRSRLFRVVLEVGDDLVHEISLLPNSLQRALNTDIFSRRRRPSRLHSILRQMNRVNYSLQGVAEVMAHHPRGLSNSRQPGCVT